MKIVKNKMTKQVEIVYGKNRYNIWNALQDISCGEYAEGGYELQKGKICVLFGDWNTGRSVKDMLDMCNIPYTEKRENALARELEKKFELEWEDEWASCSNCGKYVRTNPTSWNWTPSYALTECDITCRLCVKDVMEDILKEFINNPAKAWQLNESFLEDEGFTLLDEIYENGHGSNDVPEPILKKLQEKYKDSDFIFCIHSTGMLNVQFKVFMKARED